MSKGGRKLLDAAREALAVTRGEVPPGRMSFVSNGHVLGPGDEVREEGGRAGTILRVDHSDVREPFATVTWSDGPDGEVSLRRDEASWTWFATLGRWVVASPGRAPGPVPVTGA